MAAVRTDRTDAEIVRDALIHEYEIRSELGRGGMAVVYEAREKQLDRLVAIKVLPLSMAFDAEFVERFQREARTAAKLEHPNIIPIYRVGQTGRVSYFVMKYLRGEPLAKMIEKQGPLAPEAIRRLLVQTASALGYAHKHRIVHRDIKPDNILFDDAGHAVVTDFGIAKAATGSRLTGTGMSIGTPHYMSPEQARAKPIDGRSDIYSLGVVAYQCLTGKVPFDGEDAFSIGYKHVMDPLPTPTLETHEQRELFIVIRRMLAKSPDDRYQTAAELITALERPRARPAFTNAPTMMVHASTGQRRPATTKGAQPTPTTPIPRIDAHRTKRPNQKRKKRGGALVGLFILFMLGGGGAGGYWYLLMGDQWPPSFVGSDISLSGVWTALRGGEAVAQEPPQPELPAHDDTLSMVPVDSLAADPPAPDSLAPAPVDTAPVPEPAAAELPNTGTLEFRGVPALGKVTLDGDDVVGSLISVPAGSHRIRVTALGYEDYSSTVPVGRGERIIVQVQMRRAEETADSPSSRVFSREVAEDRCELPGPSYNADGSCFETPPVTAEPAVVVLPAGVKVVPPPATLWLRIESDGRVDRIIPASKTDLRFARQAAQVAKRMPFQPAQKLGKPVAAWVRLTFEGEPGR